MKIILKGVAASSGKATGKAKIVKTNADFQKVTEGDVLICPTSNPSMTIIMQKACGIVTDYGGLGSHAAIVARELGIPCVVGTTQATQIITDQTELLVDGDKGVVYVKD